MSETRKYRKGKRKKGREKERGRERYMVDRGDTVEEEKANREEDEELVLFITKIDIGAQLLSNCLPQQVYAVMV